MEKKHVIMLEEIKLETIKKVVNDSITKNMAAEILSCTRRNVNLLIAKYKQYGDSAFIHKSRGRLSEKRIGDDIREKILYLYKTKYTGLDYQSFFEKLNEIENIKVSYEWIRNFMFENKIYSSRLKRATKERIIAEEKNNPD